MAQDLVQRSAIALAVDDRPPTTVNLIAEASAAYTSPASSWPSANPGESRRASAKSAGAPTAGAAPPISFARWPVAISQASAAVTAAGSAAMCFWMRANAFTSSSRSRELLEPAPSVPRPTWAPAARAAAYGNTPPTPSFWLATGFVTIVAPRSTISSISDWSSQTQWASSVRGPSIPVRSR